jgi:antitoxin component YwqK of YwqJK toxin-antitoxin module
MNKNTETLSVGVNTDDNRNTNNQTVDGETTINRTYWENGNPKEVETLSNGVRNGLWESYYGNGQLEEKGNYINGYGEGLWEYYHRNGVKSCILYYLKGDVNGRVNHFHTNGKLRISGNLKSGKMIGIWEYYHRNGEIREVVLYKEGIKKGIVKPHYKKGKLCWFMSCYDEDLGSFFGWFNENTNKRNEHNFEMEN